MIKIDKPVYILSGASVVGMEEADGPLGEHFEVTEKKDDTFGCKSWEKAESEMQRIAMGMAMTGAGLKQENIDVLLAGDLLNQCIGSNYGLLSYDIPYIGLYGACSTAAEGLLLAALCCGGGTVKRCASVASSHNASSERQFRSPLEYGGQRSPTAQWTVTGSAAYITTSCRDDFDFFENKSRYIPRITAVSPGVSLDSGVTDISNMGAAMAPAAAQTIGDFLKDTNTKPEDYDLILTGDLGSTGSALLKELMRKEYCTDISTVHNDCGMMIFDLEKQDMHSGGSGCGCSASVVCSYILNKLSNKELNKVLFVGTGALLSPTSSMQKESTPGIAHGVLLTS